MSRRIIGVTVGSPLPKPNLMQNDPSKVDYVKGKEAFLQQNVDLAGYAKTEDIPTKPGDIGAQPSGEYALKSEIPSVPVKSVNGKTGAVSLTASDVGARPSTWMPSHSDVGADKSGTASTVVSTHNTETDAHNDIRLLIQGLTTRLDALANSDDDTLDQMAEVVAYIKANRDLIDQITTGKVSVSDIINNLTTNVANKPLSAAQGVQLKGLIDSLNTSLSNYQPKGDYALNSAIPTKVSQLQNDSKYLTQHQDISGKLNASELPTAINTALAQAKASGEFDGKTPVKGTDYWTAADKEEMIQDVISALGGSPIFGVVDVNNNIVLSGNLTDGTYTIKYEDADGKVTEIGTLKQSSVTYTNLFVPSTASLNTRMSGSSKAPKSENGYVMTAAIMLPTAFNMTGSPNEHFIAVPSGMWANSANVFIGNSAGDAQGYNDVAGPGATVVGNWAKIPLFNKWGNSNTCDRVIVSLYVKGSAITASDIQNIEIYFDEIPE